MSQFSDNQFNRIANIFDNAGQVVLGVAVLSPLIGLNNTSLPIAIAGIIVVVFCWLASIWLAKKGD